MYIHSLFIYLLIFFTAASGCRKKDIDVSSDDDELPCIFKPTPCDSTLTLLWQRPIRPDTFYAECQVYTENGIMVMGNHWERLAKVNVESSTENLVLDWVLDSNTLDRSYFGQQKLIEITEYGVICVGDNGGRDIYAFDTGGQELWHFQIIRSPEMGFGGPFFSRFADKIYKPSRHYDKDNNDILYEIDITTGAYQKVFEQPWIGNFKALLDPPVGYLVGGDTIATFQIRYYDTQTLASRTDVVAWNVSKRDTLWRIDYATPYNNDSANPILYEDGKLYYAAAYNILCLDAGTGEKLWQQDYDMHHYSFAFSNLLLMEAGLVTKSSGEEIAMLDKETGDILWENRGVEASPTHLTHYRGDIYMTAVGRISCIDGGSGFLKWKMLSPNHCIDSRASYTFNMMAIDPARNRLFVSDNFFIQCFQLPE